MGELIGRLDKMGGVKTLRAFGASCQVIAGRYEFIRPHDSSLIALYLRV
ncbi:MAG TPA: hypothetical protein VGV87_10930 [Blastocatellia bacterium]|nr:hypothetical protein [Blastocatellia bacterium]